eukprot:gene26080-34099_t
MCSLKNQVEELRRYVGKRLREKRNKLGLSLAELGAGLNIAPQQLQKYECAESTVSANRLYQIGCLFGVNIDYFFNGFNAILQNATRVPQAIIQPDRTVHLKVLLIEDNDSDAYLTRKAFEVCPVKIDILVMHNHRDVFRFLQGQKTDVVFPQPDLILLDLNLPKMDGLSILRKIKQDSMLSHIPVVILSHSISLKDMVTCYKNYASGFIAKSFDFDVFREKLNLLARYWAQTVVLPSRVHSHNERVLK